MKRLTLALLFFFAAHAAAAQAQAPQAGSTPALRRKTFERVWTVVRDRFYDPNFNGVDWDDARRRYEPLADAAQTDAELYRVLNRMLGELKVSHMAVVPPEELAASASPPVTTGMELWAVEGRAAVARVLPGSAAERAGVRPGFVVTRVNGQEVKTLEHAQDLLDGEPGAKVRVAFLDGRDGPREAELERTTHARGEVARDGFGKFSLHSLFEARRLEGGIGYIRFTRFIPSLDAKLRRAVASMRGAPGLIIDLRGNGGGDDSVGVKLAGLLFDRPKQLMVTRRRGGDDLYYRARPARRPYLGPLVLLVDGGSGSASEQLAAGLQEAGRAYVVGKTTAGNDLDAELEELPTGAYFFYAVALPRTPKGVVIEGRGVIPDLEVDLTREGLLRGEDAQLAAAVRHIKSRKANGSR
jgi:carboxyl-terminal processing protease